MQAFLITAYKDEKQLTKLIERVSQIGYVYVHVDTKSKEIDVEKLNSMGFKDTEIISKYKIYWGAMNHVHAILDLMRKALDNPKIHYIHIISGQDYPVRSNDDFINTFDEDYRSIHMSCSDRGVYDSGVVDRYALVHPSVNMDPTSFMARAINKIALGFQHTFKIRKQGIGEFRDVYKGMIYMSAPRDAAQYVLDYLKEHPRFLKDLQYAHIPEEFLFQTVLKNSGFAENVTGVSLRYNDWAGGDGKSPAYINEEKYDEIKHGEYFFARKIMTGMSDRLLDRLENVEG